MFCLILLLQESHARNPVQLSRPGQELFLVCTRQPGCLGSFQQCDSETMRAMHDTLLQPLLIVVKCLTCNVATVTGKDIVAVTNLDLHRKLICQVGF